MNKETNNNTNIDSNIKIEKNKNKDINISKLNIENNSNTNDYNSEYIETSKEIINQFNKIRDNPCMYKTIFKYWKSKFYGNTLYLLNEEYSIETKDGEQSVEKAINYLNELELKKFRLKAPIFFKESEELNMAAMSYATYIGEIGATGHEADNKSVSERIDKYIDWEGKCIEMIQFGIKNPVNILCNIILDPNHSNNRNYLFDYSYKYIGVGFAKHIRFGYCCVIILVEEICLNNSFKIKYDFLKKYITKKDIENDTSDSYDVIQLLKSKSGLDIDDITPKVYKSKKIINEVNKHSRIPIKKIIYTLNDNTQQIFEIMI